LIIIFLIIIPQVSSRASLKIDTMGMDLTSDEDSVLEEGHHQEVLDRQQLEMFLAQLGDPSPTTKQIINKSLSDVGGAPDDASRCVTPSNVMVKVMKEEVKAKATSPKSGPSKFLYSSDFATYHCFMTNCKMRGCQKSHRGTKGYIYPSMIMWVQ